MIQARKPETKPRKRDNQTFAILPLQVKGRQTGGGGSRSGLVLPFLSFLGLGDGPGIFPICPFSLSRPIKSTYEEQSQKGPRHNLDLSRFSFSQKSLFIVRSRGLAILSQKSCCNSACQLCVVVAQLLCNTSSKTQRKRSEKVSGKVRLQGTNALLC